MLTINPYISVHMLTINPYISVHMLMIKDGKHENRTPKSWLYVHCTLYIQCTILTYYLNGLLFAYVLYNMSQESGVRPRFSSRGQLKFLVEAESRILFYLFKF